MKVVEPAHGYQPICCDKHDFIEIACTFRYEVEMALSDGRHSSMRFVTTLTDNEGKEWVVGEDAESGVSLKIRLDCIKSIKARWNNLNLGDINFSSHDK